MPTVNVKFQGKDTNKLGKYTFVDSTDDDGSIALSTVTSTAKLGAKLAGLKSSSGLTTKHILADIDKFRFNVRNILITKYNTLRAPGVVGALDENGATGTITTSDAGGLNSYLKTDCGITTGRYIAKGMENWIPTNDEGNRIRGGNNPLQLDVSKGWISILGKDKNGEFNTTVERGKSSKVGAYEKPAPGTYHHVAVVLNKWHKVGMEMYIGDSGASNTAQKLVTNGDLARENNDFGLWNKDGRLRGYIEGTASGAYQAKDFSSVNKKIILEYGANGVVNTVTVTCSWNASSQTIMINKLNTVFTTGTGAVGVPGTVALLATLSGTGPVGIRIANTVYSTKKGQTNYVKVVTVGTDDDVLKTLGMTKTTSGDSIILKNYTYDPWGHHFIDNEKWSDAIKGDSEFIRYKYRIGQKLEKVTAAVTANNSGLTMANNHFSNRNFNGERRGNWTLTDVTTSTGKLNITNDEASTGTTVAWSKKLEVGDCVIFMDSFKGAGLLINQAMSSKSPANLTGTIANKTYENLTHTGGTGTGATFDVVISSGDGTVSSVTTKTVGSGYKIGDVLTIAKEQISGATHDLTITLQAADFGSRSGSIPNNSTIRHGGTYFVVDAKSGAIGLATTPGGTVINAGNGKGSTDDYLVQHAGFRKELETYPTGSKDVGCMFLAREKFNWYETSGVTIGSGLTFASAHKIPYGTAVEYTDNGVANIPELVSGNKYYVVDKPEWSSTAKSKHVLLSLTKHGTPIPINSGGGAAGNKIRVTRPLAYDEVHWLRESDNSAGIWANSEHNSTDKLANMSYEPLVLVKKLNPPLKITKKTKDVKFTWKMGGAGRLNLWKENLGGADWTTHLDGDVHGKGAGRQEQGVVLNINELNFSVKAI